MNRLISAQIAGQTQTTLYTYNTRGLVTKIISPAGGKELSVYDANGNLISHTDANGNVTTYEHDPLGRLIRANYYDGKVATFAFDYAGRLTELHDWTGTTQFEHDILGRLTQVIDPMDNITKNTWDERGNRTSVTVTNNSGPMPITATTTYTFDAANRMSSMSAAGLRGASGYFWHIYPAYALHTHIWVLR